MVSHRRHEVQAAPSCKARHRQQEQLHQLQDEPESFLLRVPVAPPQWREMATPQAQEGQSYENYWPLLKVQVRRYRHVEFLANLWTLPTHCAQRP